MGFAGVAKVKAAKEMYVPKMTEEGWFDASTEQSHTEGAGYTMAFIGFVFLSVFVTLAVGIIAKKLTTTPEEEAAAAAKEINATKRYKQKLKELTGANDKEIDEYDEENEDEIFDEDFDSAKILQHATNTTTNPNRIYKQPKYCAFCGSENARNATKCSSCGASFTLKK